MKRYIEIVYDNSGSMENLVGNKLKYEIAQELSEKEILKWEKILGVNVKTYFVQKMKTKWGSCKHKSQNIRLNTELVKKPKDLEEYVIVHEMLHLLVPTHNDHFLALMNKYYPNWHEARLELNKLPLGHVEWK